MDPRKYLCEWNFSDDFIEQIETFAIWSDGRFNRNVLFVTKNREVYAAESMSADKFTKSCLEDLSYDSSSADSETSSKLYDEHAPVKLSPLCEKRIKKCIFGAELTFFCTEEGEVFVYGYEYSKTRCRTIPIPPQKVYALEKECVVDIAIGPEQEHLALCDNGKLYMFEIGNKSKYPIDSRAIKSKPLNVLKVTDSFFISLLEDGKVMKIVISDADFFHRARVLNIVAKYRCEVMNFEKAANPGKIVKLVQGYLCAFALDEYGYLFVTGCNRNKQLGMDFHDPKRLMLCENFKHNSFISETVVDIAASCFCPLSAALTESGKVYMWGKGRSGTISEPQLTPFESLHEVFYYYSSPLITYKPINVKELPALTSKPMKELDLAVTDARNTLIDSFTKAFDDPKFCDLFVVVEGKTIPVHKSILAVRCEHFADVFQKDWPVEKPSVLEIEDGDFKVYKTFLKYVYTDQMDDTLTFDELIELLNLANKYNVKSLTERCISLVQPNIAIGNVVSLYERVTVMSNVTKMNDILDHLRESCVKFCANNFFVIAVSDEFAKLNEKMSKELVVEVGRLKIKE